MSQGRKDHLRFLSSEFFWKSNSDTEKCWWVLEQWKGMSQVSQDHLRFLSPVHCGGNLKNASWQFDGVMSTNLDPIWTISLKRMECWWSRCQLWTNYMELILLCHQLWTREWTLDFLISDLKQCLFSDHGGWLTKSRCHWRTLGWQQIYAWWTQGQVISIYCL